jgi:tRNA(fMet)-specific endonuclease VapC
MMYCLDTNVVVDIFRGDEDLKEKVNKIISFGRDIYITPITLCELYKGVYLFHDPEKELRDVDDFLSSFILLDFGREACNIFGEEYAKLKKKGKITQEIDLMISSIAKVNDLIVVTRNKKHFEDVDVKVEVW